MSITWLVELGPFDYIIILSGALLGGFATGLAGFGTGLVASGLWLHAVPAQHVPPLVLLVSLVGQLIAKHKLSIGLNKGAAFLSPLVIGGALGIPLGVLTLTGMSPGSLRLSIGVLMIAYVLWQLFGPADTRIDAMRGPAPEALAGFGGGYIGGLAGIPGPLPLIFLQLRGGTRQEQRASYLPYSLVMLCVGCVAFVVSGHLDVNVAGLAAICLPVILAGTWIGSNVFLGLDENQFRKLLAGFLLFAGLSLMPW